MVEWPLWFWALAVFTVLAAVVNIVAFIGMHQQDIARRVREFEPLDWVEDGMVFDLDDYGTPEMTPDPDKERD